MSKAINKTKVRETGNFWSFCHSILEMVRVISHYEDVPVTLNDHSASLTVNFTLYHIFQLNSIWMSMWMKTELYS